MIAQLAPLLPLLEALPARIAAAADKRQGHQHKRRRDDSDEDLGLDYAVRKKGRPNSQESENQTQPSPQEHVSPLKYRSRNPQVHSSPRSVFSRPPSRTPGSLDRRPLAEINIPVSQINVGTGPQASLLSSRISQEYAAAPGPQSASRQLSSARPAALNNASARLPALIPAQPASASVSSSAKDLTRTASQTPANIHSATVHSPAVPAAPGPDVLNTTHTHATDQSTRQQTPDPLARQRPPIGKPVSLRDLGGTFVSIVRFGYRMSCVLILRSTLR
ncbi:hypothetical protein PLICRDRAFT_249303 [Plicaturopsis crispa FD-325 SS-3]|nr:hypothetical protein PLICRDRAFT_249303 [Plicaturopsis crispa FD-325 SS-3]